MTRDVLEMLYRRIQNTMRDNQCDAQKAMRVLHREIAGDPDDLAQLWEDFGVFWLQAAERHYWGRIGVVLPVDPSAAPAVPAETTAPPRKTSGNGKPNPAWHANVNPMDILVKVGRGERKRAGSLTREDCLAKYSLHHQQGESLIVKARGWQSLATAIPEGKTLEVVLPDLPAQDRTFLSGELRVSVESAVEVKAAA